MPWRFERGFTIIEALVTLAVVATGVLSLAMLARQVTETVAWSRRQLAAAVLADAFVAAQLGRPLAATPGDCLEHDVGGCTESLDGAGRPTGGRPAFVRRWRVIVLNSAPAPAWSLVACVVPVNERLVARPTPGACVTRIVAAVAP